MTSYNLKRSYHLLLTFIVIGVVGIHAVLLLGALLNGENVVLNPSSYLLYDELKITPYDIGEKFVKYFDTDKRTIFTLEYKGKHFEYVFYDNRLPLAGRYELLMNGERVEDPELAKEVFSIAVWNSDEIKSKILNLNVHDLMEIRSDADQIASVVSPLYTAVHTLKGYFDKTKTIKVYGVSLFDIITKDTRVYYFYRAISELDPELGGWKTASERCVSGIDTVLGDIDYVRTSEIVDPQKLKNDFSAASYAISAYSWKFDSISHGIGKILEYSEYAEDFLRKYPQASFIVSSIDKVESIARNVQSRIEGYSEKVSANSAQIKEILEIAERKESEYFAGYINGFAVPFLYGSTILLTSILLLMSVVLFAILTENKREQLRNNVKLVVLGLFVSAVAAFTFLSMNDVQLQSGLVHPDFENSKELVLFLEGKLTPRYMEEMSQKTLKYYGGFVLGLFIYGILMWSFVIAIDGFIHNDKVKAVAISSFVFLHLAGYVTEYIIPAVLVTPLFLLLLIIFISLMSPFLLALNNRTVYSGFSGIIEIIITCAIFYLQLYYLNNYLSNNLWMTEISKHIWIQLFIFIAMILLSATTSGIFYLLRLPIPIAYLLYLSLPIWITFVYDITCNPYTGSCNLSSYLYLVMFVGFFISIGGLVTLVSVERIFVNKLYVLLKVLVIFIFSSIFFIVPIFLIVLYKSNMDLYNIISIISYSFIMYSFLSPSVWMYIHHPVIELRDRDIETKLTGKETSNDS